MSGTTTTYGTVQSGGFWPTGAVKTLNLTAGTGFTQSSVYDSRLRPTSLSLTTSGGTETLTYAWLPNSNLQTEAIANSQNSASTLTQTFAYDTVNRLISAVETGGSSEWAQYYGYDQFGNRSLLTGGSFNTSFIPHTGVTPQVSAPSTLGQTVAGPFTNNQWTGATYDAAGNLETDATVTTTSSAKYDAENRLLTVNDPTLSATPNFQYYYDGNGHRVMKVLCSTSPCSTTTSGAEITTYVYDPSGQLAAEYGSPSSVSGTQYLFADHLGSTRILAGSAGGFTRCFDYAPFGEELAPTYSRANCYSDVTYPSATPEAETAKFTSKERDSESGLDYFGARYFSSAQGRFTSVDPKQFSSRTLSNPQKWNKYAYVLNNPLASFDPDGKEEIKVTVRAFIPDSSFRYPAGIGPTWKGDGRSFSLAPDASSRAQATFTIETDPAISAQPLVGTPTFSTSGSAVDFYGLHTFTGNSDVTGNVSMNTRLSDGTSVVSLSMSASDPLILGAPSTGGTFTFNVAPNGSSVSMNGTIAAYPAFEVNVQNTNTGAQGTLLQYTPQGTSANSPGALLTGATLPVRGTTTLPDKPQKQCATGDANCQ